MRWLMHSIDALVLADSLALVDALCEAEVLCGF